MKWRSLSLHLLLYVAYIALLCLVLAGLSPFFLWLGALPTALGIVLGVGMGYVLLTLTRRFTAFLETMWPR